MKKKVCIAAILLLFHGVMIVLFRLYGLYAAAILVLSQAGTFLYFKISKKRERSRQDYYEVTIYMEQFLCSYKRLGHVRMALEDCLNIFEEGSKMHSAIGRMIHIMETGEGAGGEMILSQAFNEINGIYNSRRMRMMHHYLCQIEQIGGDVITSMDIMLGDLQSWKQRTILYQKKKIFLQKEVFLASAFALFLCYVTHLILPYNIVQRFEGMAIYQISTTVVILAFWVLTLVVYNSSAKSWLDSSKGMGNTIEEEFPYWLLSVSLYLQQDSVYHAIQQSCHGLKGEFRKEVCRLLDNIYEMPNSLLPYVNFFRNQDLPELHTGMKILYSYTNNGYQDTQKQVHFFVEQNHRLIEQKESNHYQVALSGFQLVKQIPMLIAGGKIVLDAVVFAFMIAKNAMII